MTKIFFGGDRPLLGVNPHGRPKSRTGPPRGVTNFFSSLRMLKIHFDRKLMFFTSILVKNLPSSGDQNFASFAWIFPGLKTCKFLTLGGATLSTEISATSEPQKFLNLQNLKKKNFLKSRFFKILTIDFFNEGGAGRTS